MTRVVSSHNCYICKADRVLMLHRSESVPRFPGFWMGPGGRQEPFEDVVQSCIAHVKAESGLDVKNLRLKVFATNHHLDKDEVYLVFIFVADYADGNLKDYARGELEWIPKDEILSLGKLYPDLRVHIPLVFDGTDEIYYTHIEYRNLQILNTLVRTNSGIVGSNS